MKVVTGCREVLNLDSDDLRNVSIVGYFRPVIDEMLSCYTSPVVRSGRRNLSETMVP